MTVTIAKLSLLGLALALAGAGPALAASKKPVTHAKHAAPMSSTEDLNAKSLAAAQQGQAFMPTGSPAPAAAPATATPKKM